MDPSFYSIQILSTSEMTAPIFVEAVCNTLNLLTDVVESAIELIPHRHPNLTDIQAEIIQEILLLISFIYKASIAPYESFIPTDENKEFEEQLESFESKRIVLSNHICAEVEQVVDEMGKVVAVRYPSSSKRTWNECLQELVIEGMKVTSECVTVGTPSNHLN